MHSAKPIIKTGFTLNTNYPLIFDNLIMHSS